MNLNVKKFKNTIKLSSTLDSFNNINIPTQNELKSIDENYIKSFKKKLDDAIIISQNCVQFQIIIPNTFLCVASNHIMILQNQRFLLLCSTTFKQNEAKIVCIYKNIENNNK